MGYSCVVTTGEEVNNHNFNDKKEPKMNQNTPTKTIQLEQFTKSDYDAFSGVVEIDNKALIGEFEKGLVIIDDEKIEFIFLDPNIDQEANVYQLYDIKGMKLKTWVISNMRYDITEEKLLGYGFTKVL